MENRLIVSAIIINESGQIFLQKRFKPKASPAYLDVWEIPAGGVDPGEDVFTAVKREVREETGYEVAIIDPRVSIRWTQVQESEDKVQVFEPFICQQMLKTEHGLGWVGFVFLCKIVGGELKMQTEEAKDPTWVNLAQLKKMLANESFFSLQVPVLEYLLNEVNYLKLKLLTA